MTSPFIETYLGKRFQPLAPTFADIEIADIAHATSNQCRFSGHTRHFYSVAEHSVRVSLLIEEWEHDKPTQLWGLLHDASEAYLVDLPTPLKKHRQIGTGYRFAEAGLMKAVCRRFGLQAKEPAVVRQADAVMLATEVRDLMYHRAEHWAALKEAPHARRLVPWQSKTAEHEFLRRFKELTR